ncbi:ATPase [Bifidobacterium reuteri DSM 23975]|uniref:ATPase n=1 Tax=Bifidobacterium reuteri DSM 23975 TaxID=1437610 RepID=A0A087CXS4_9BIFI|nr:AAA family ATPase [Bifidobacterium reuteri]KFI88074.1 ATPase [Bifidobacterium reuteri DSM 23975]
MTETKEFHELFSQGSGRIFALLISTDGRGHYDNRGRLSLDYCEAGQTFDLPNGMFDSDKYRDSDVVLTFAKTQNDNEFVLTDVHSAKHPVVNSNNADDRPGSIHFNGSKMSLDQFYSENQNSLTLWLDRSSTPISSTPHLLDFTDLYYARCLAGSTSGTINEWEFRRNLFDAWMRKQQWEKDKSYSQYVKALDKFEDSYRIPRADGAHIPVTAYLPTFEHLWQVVDAARLQRLGDDWTPVKKLYSATDTEIAEQGFTPKGIKYYAQFLTENTAPSASRNLIYFGAPGTGKSYTLNKGLEQFDGRYERVTFYSDYLHAQFVGSFRPQAITTADGTADFTYAFTPGPFTRVLIDALKDPDNEHVLVIEEINRADPAAVFGDIFQLLDRDGSGVSTYPVTVSEDMKSYLWKELGPAGREQLLKTTKQTGITTEGSAPTSLSIAIPKNMLIWATMNSADQGVYPMDTAFKRRWSFRYIDIDAGADEITDSTWKQWRTIINKLLLTKAKVSEDKLLGPFFLGDPKMAVGTPEFDDAFKNKVIMYLFEDAARYNRDKVFNAARISSGNTSSIEGLTLQSLFSAWDKIRFDIFNKSNE